MGEGSGEVASTVINGRSREKVKGQGEVSERKRSVGGRRKSCQWWCGSVDSMPRKWAQRQR